MENQACTVEGASASLPNSSLSYRLLPAPKSVPKSMYPTQRSRWKWTPSRLPTTDKPMKDSSVVEIPSTCSHEGRSASSKMAAASVHNGLVARIGAASEIG